MSDIDMKVAIEHARAIVAQGADASSDGPFALARALLALHTRVEAMAAVVAAAKAVEATCDAVGAIEVRDPKCSGDLSRIRRAYHALRAALDGYRGAK